MKILLAQIKLKTADFDFNKKNIFEKLVFLDKKHKGKVNKIYALDKINKEYKII